MNTSAVAVMGVRNTHFILLKFIISPIFYFYVP